VIEYSGRQWNAVQLEPVDRPAVQRQQQRSLLATMDLKSR
jgi:hypothetical protein